MNACCRIWLACWTLFSAEAKLRNEWMVWNGGDGSLTPPNGIDRAVAKQGLN
ncbi:hypothetical protein SynRS9915_02432 [Synechococcus sp. RS9915]|nr:hypothetical protein SynRS9915_02432 [Synechococcus sp. RS9915]